MPFLKVAETDHEKLEDEVADKLLLEVYPDKRAQLEPVLAVVNPLLKGDVGTAMLLTRIVYTNPPIEVMTAAPDATLAAGKIAE